MTVSPPQDHLPRRPDWHCDTCAAEWPCQAARMRLADEYRRAPVTVAMYLCGQLYDAVSDLAPMGVPGIAPAGFYARFLGWLRGDDPL